MPAQKPKRDLLSALHHIERYHQRRKMLYTHLLITVGLQFAIWANWFSSYALQDRGFEGTFFTDRLTIALALLLVFIGHFVIARLNEARDRLVVQAIQAHGADEDLIEAHRARLLADEDDLEASDLEDEEDARRMLRR